jgi:hypothetical protein
MLVRKTNIYPSHILLPPTESTPKSFAYTMTKSATPTQPEKTKSKSSNSKTPNDNTGTDSNIDKSGNRGGCPPKTKACVKENLNTARGRDKLTGAPSQIQARPLVDAQQGEAIANAEALLEEVTRLKGVFRLCISPDRALISYSGTGSSYNGGSSKGIERGGNPAYPEAAG